MGPFREPGVRPEYTDPPPPRKVKRRYPLRLFLVVLMLRDVLVRSDTRRALLGLVIVLAVAMALPFSCNRGAPLPPRGLGGL